MTDRLSEEVRGALNEVWMLVGGRGTWWSGMEECILTLLILHFVQQYEVDNSQGTYKTYPLLMFFHIL